MGSSPQDSSDDHAGPDRRSEAARSAGRDPGRGPAPATRLRLEDERALIDLAASPIWIGEPHVIV